MNKFKCYLQPVPKFWELTDNKMLEKTHFFASTGGFLKRKCQYFKTIASSCVMKYFQKVGDLFTSWTWHFNTSMKPGNMNCKRTLGSELWVHVSSICET
jgi:hypothetical protein